MYLDDQQSETPIFEPIPNTMHMLMQQDLIKLYHWCLFSPPASTWITDIKNHLLARQPGQTNTAI